VTTEPESNGASQNLVDGLVGLVDSERRTRTPHVIVRPRRTRQRKAQLSLAVAVSVLIAFHAVSFGAPLVKSFFEPRPPPAVARREAQAMLSKLVEEIEIFRHDYDELPESLVEIGVPARGRWTYDVLGKKDYTLRGSLYGQGVAFDSTSRAGAR
jgi:hypothetical protein